MYKTYSVFTLLTVFLLSNFSLQAQYFIEGKVMDETANQPIAFATAALLDAKDSVLISGVTTGEAGAFKIECPSGEYLIKISHLGFEDYFSQKISPDIYDVSISLGEIPLAPVARTLEEVEIEAEKSSMELALDKRVFNVGLDASNAGANASEILGNLPSVSVDGEGTVKLRGSADVRILIDGKPSALINSKGGEGLKQLQGNLIESVEIITNPSARYEAEGNAGVINIILKKERKEGFNGSFEVVLGQPNNFGVSANVNYRYKKINFFIDYGISYRHEPNIGNLYQEIYEGDSTFISVQSTEGLKKGLYNNIRGGLDYYFNEKNILTAAYRFQRSDAIRITDFRYEDYLNSLSVPTGISLRNQYEEESEPYSEYALTYKKQFTRKGHEFNADVRYLNYWENSDQLYTEQRFLPGQTAEQGSTFLEDALNDEFEDQYLLQLDYIQPFAKEGKLEAGYRGSFRKIINDYVASAQDEQGIWQVLPEFDNVFQYDENIHAVYGIMGSKKEKISYQAGLRVEATEVVTTLKETNEVNPRNYTNFFPSAHLSFHLSGNNDLQISYSRRIRRPVYRELSPFVTLSDRRNFFSGNPDLDPAYTHTFEIGHLKYFEKGSLSSAIYYRNSSGTIQSVRRVDAQGFSTRLPENFNGQESFGAEMAYSYTLYSWWKLDASVNFYRAITDGTNINSDFTSDAYSWFARQNSKFTLPKQFVIQFRANYDAPEITAQGKRKSLYYFDLAIQKDIWDRKGRITLNAMDVLNSRISRNTFVGENFLSDTERARVRRQVNLTFTYRLNQ